MPATPYPFHHGAVLLADGSVVWNVWAPRAPRVDLVFPEDGGHVPMQAAERGWFAHREPYSAEGRRYAFRLHAPSVEPRTLPDPASRWQPEGVHRPSALFFPETFMWTDRAWCGVPRESLVFYELHVGTFTEAGTLAAIEPRLAELADLGITAIEIMPVGQFPGERDWGYDGVHPFAVQNSYGGPRALQQLVDACHRRGLAVFLDVIYNHLGPEGNYTAAFGPYTTDEYRTPWGPGWNFDDRGSDGVRQFVCENVAYWLREFHFDGLRLDAVHAIFDRSPRHILTDIQHVAEQISAETGRQIHIIAESDMNDVRLLDPIERRGNALAGTWNDDFHHSIHALLTGERNGYYADFGKPEHLVKALNQTFVYDGNYSTFRQRNHGAPAGDRAHEQFVVAIQTHDQVGNRARGDRLSALLSADQQLLAAGVLLLSPYTPLLFMGEEYGETRPFPFFCSFGDRELVDAVERGRVTEFQAFGWQGAVPSPSATATFRAAKLTWRWPCGSHQARLRDWYRWLLELRRTRLSPDDRQSHAVWHPTGLGDGAHGVLELVRTAVRPGGTIRALFNVSPAAAPVPAGLSTEVEAGKLLRSSLEGNEPVPAAPLAPFEVRLFFCEAEADG